MSLSRIPYSTDDLPFKRDLGDVYAETRFFKLYASKHENNLFYKTIDAQIAESHLLRLVQYEHLLNYARQLNHQHSELTGDSHTCSDPVILHALRSRKNYCAGIRIDLKKYAIIKGCAYGDGVALGDNLLLVDKCPYYKKIFDVAIEEGLRRTVAENRVLSTFLARYFDLFPSNLLAKAWSPTLDEERPIPDFLSEPPFLHHQHSAFMWQHLVGYGSLGFPIVEQMPYQVERYADCARFIKETPTIGYDFWFPVPDPRDSVFLVNRETGEPRVLLTGSLTNSFPRKSLEEFYPDLRHIRYAFPLIYGYQGQDPHAQK